MKSTGKSPVSTNKSPMAVYINDVSPGPADCKRLDPSEVQRRSWKSIATKPCIHILLNMMTSVHACSIADLLLRGHKLGFSEALAYQSHMFHNNTDLSFHSIANWSCNTDSKDWPKEDADASKLDRLKWECLLIDKSPW
ncbi:unnamed protein product [Brassica rapa subsp. trilocularis]